MEKEIPIGIHFARCVEVLESVFGRNRVNQQFFVVVWIEATSIQQSVDEFYDSQLSQQYGVKRDFIDPISYLSGRDGCFLTP